MERGEAVGGGVAAMEGCRGGKGAYLHSARAAQAHCPIVGFFSRDHPENHPPPRKHMPRRQNSRFRQQSGISMQNIVCFDSLSELLD